ncbi:type II secretion system protein [Aliidiomarina halalkaliphila]|uniref:Type II secretion system protein n=1 Tax=Aliidiomarina halalkaliphila TaxID=2593535 RepID=A0A552X675_9GAMM|nr:type II secretion system protein [Aliidiomarina halalkaliphila]TRW50460.1 type II secretion system protein [Aliidiomarina halalkaliphila]
MRMRGFTLVELIAVMVILSVISAGTFAYLRLSGLIFIDVTERDALIQEARFAMERFSREARASLPGSARLTGDNDECIEFVPVVAGGTYVRIPTASLSNDARIVTPANYTFLSGDRLAVAVRNSAQAYATSGYIYEIDALNSGPGDTLDVTLSDSSALFATQSMAQRYRIVREPISWCVIEVGNTQQLWRFSGYGWQVSQPDVSPLLSAPSAQLMGQRLDIQFADVNQRPFQVDAPTLREQGLIQVRLRFRRPNTDESVLFYREVVIANAI